VSGLGYLPAGGKKGGNRKGWRSPAYSIQDSKEGNSEKGCGSRTKRRRQKRHSLSPDGAALKSR